MLYLRYMNVVFEIHECCHCIDNLNDIFLCMYNVAHIACTLSCKDHLICFYWIAFDKFSYF